MPARLASITEMSLGPPQGSLGVILEEGSAEAGSDADEGQSAPRSTAKTASHAKDGAAAKGNKRCAGACLDQATVSKEVHSVLPGGF